LTQAVDKGLLAREGDRVWPTVRGLDFLSDLQSLFLPD
jgi:oxygen-independent coproporphyrinogen-3 oxidase